MIMVEAFCKKIVLTSRQKLGKILKYKSFLAILLFCAGIMVYTLDLNCNDAFQNVEDQILNNKLESSTSTLKICE